MTMRERLHKKIDGLDDGVLPKLTKVLEDIEAGQDAEAQRTEETIALWEAFAEPMDDEAAQKKMVEAIEARSRTMGPVTL